MMKGKRVQIPLKARATISSFVVVHVIIQGVSGSPVPNPSGPAHVSDISGLSFL